LKSIIGRGVIIDDSSYNQELLRKIIEDNNFQILGIADSGKQGFSLVAETRPDIVFLDISLPDLSSEEVIRGLLSINRNLKIVLMASTAVQRPVYRLLTLGASDYIPKPVVREQLEYLLKKLELEERHQKLSKLQLVGFLHGIFYSEIVKTASKENSLAVLNAVKKPLKRLMKQYSKRYDINLTTYRIFVNVDEENRTLVKKVTRQLNNLYRGVVRNLEKIMQFEILTSFLQEAYQSFYNIAGEIYTQIDYNFPTWKGYTPTFVKSTISEKRKVIEYIPLANYIWKTELKYISDFSRLKIYSTIVNYDPRNSPKFPRKIKREVDIYGIYSIFDNIVGPKTAIVYPPAKSQMVNEELRSIPKLLDLTGAREMEPFIHASETFASVNLIFVTDRKDMRGSYFDQMLSICVMPLDVTVLAKLSQLKGILRAIVAQISESIQRMSLQDIQDLGKYKSEPAEIIADLVDEVRRFIE